MNGIWALLLLLLVSVLPAMIAFVWYRAANSPVTAHWFLLSLTAGIFSLFPAALIQNFFPYGPANGLGYLLFGVFIRVALAEEASRLVVLTPLLKISARRRSIDSSFAAAIGLVAGLGFAAAENAFYGTADFRISLFRAFTAAPLHAACAIRTSLAVFHFRQKPPKALFLFASAVIIHGAYNLMIISPSFPSVLAVPAAIAAFFATLPYLRDSENDN